MKGDLLSIRLLDLNYTCKQNTLFPYLEPTSYLLNIVLNTLIMTLKQMAK